MSINKEWLDVHATVTQINEKHHNLNTGKIFRTLITKDNVEFKNLKITLEYDESKLSFLEKKLLSKIHKILSPSGTDNIFKLEEPKSVKNLDLKEIIQTDIETIIKNIH